MRFPVVRERVHVQGRDGTFLVLAVDRQRGMVDVISASPGGQVENVPLSSILRLSREEIPNAEGKKNPKT